MVFKLSAVLRERLQERTKLWHEIAIKDGVVCPYERPEEVADFGSSGATEPETSATCQQLRSNDTSDH